MRPSLSPPSRLAASALALSTVLLAAIAMAVGPGPSALDRLDPNAAALAASAALPLIELTNLAGSLPIWAVALAIVWAIGTARSWPFAVQGVAVSLLAEVSSVVLKLVVGRERPAGADASEFLVAAGFPSGHVTRTAVLVGVLLTVVPVAARHRRLAVVSGLMAAAFMGVARVASGEHYASDVLGGVLLASVVCASWAVVIGRQRSAGTTATPAELQRS